MSNNIAKEGKTRVCDTANELFPDLHLRINDLSNPTEAFLTKTLIHYLRAFGFRLEPPFNIDSEANDTSREKRIFLIKLCRQVERIVQISFPTRSFTYYDIIKPTSKKTISMLDVLFNYWCYYKMYKKDVFNLVEERIKQREALCATNLAKRRELEQRKQNAAQLKSNTSECKAKIEELRQKLQPAQSELRKKEKAVQQQKLDLEVMEKQLADVNGQLQHWQTLAVEDSKAQELKDQLEKMVAKIESCKAEVAQLAQTLKERRVEIETNQALFKEVDTALEELSPQLLAEYKENLKLKDRIEKQYASKESENKQLLLTYEHNKQLKEQSLNDFKQRQLHHEQETQKMQQQIQEQQADIQERINEVEFLSERSQELQAQNEEQDCIAQALKQTIGEILGV